jgi:multicomponent K+:H+ antiporter subunit E
MLRRIFPHPVMTAALIVIWLLLVNRFQTGSLVMAVILGTAIPLLTRAWWPGNPRINSLPALLGYVLLVVWDILVANVIVAKIILFRPNDRIQSRWITVPLDLRTPEAITMLAATITLTPGTVTADMSACGRALLIHALHAPDPDAVRDAIKSRYESRLKRIFE